MLWIGFVSLETPFIYIFHVCKHDFLLQHIADVPHLEMTYPMQELRAQGEDSGSSGLGKNRSLHIAAALPLVELQSLWSKGIFTNDF